MLGNILPPKLFLIHSWSQKQEKVPDIGGTLSYRDEQKLKQTTHRAFRNNKGLRNLG